MSLPTSIFSRLSADAGVSALVGSGVAARVYPMRTPDAPTFPLVVWQLVGSAPDQTHNDASDFDVSLVQFTCYARSYSDAYALRRAVRLALDNATLAGGEKAVIEMERDQYEHDIDAEACLLDVTFLRNAQA